MIKKYLEENTYGFTIYAEFEKNGLKHVVATEHTPSGSECELFFLYEKDGKIFNQNDDDVELLMI